MSSDILPRSSGLPALPSSVPASLGFRVDRAVGRVLGTEAVQTARLEANERLTARAMLGASNVSRLAGVLSAADPMVEGDVALLKVVGISNAARILSEGV